VNCREANELIHPYVDGELDLVKTLEIESHIRECAQCAAIHRNVVALRASIRDGSVYYRAPVGLERRIRLKLPQPRKMAIGKWTRSWIAVAAVALVALSTWIATILAGGGGERLLASEVTSAHVRSLMAEHLWDVKSTDQHTVKPWFDGKLDFAPDVRDFKDQSFALEGGRLDYLENRPVAALVYRHDKHYVNLFVWPAAGRTDQGETITSDRGYSLIHWVSAGMNHWAISDMSEDSLRRFAKLAHDQTATTKPAG
jgi:anti-sigma factor RsiW